jgi:diguanylate cyclase (GGDEF)-like protein
MAAPYMLAAGLAAAAESLLDRAPRSEGEELGAEDLAARDEQAVVLGDFPARARSRGFVGRMLEDEHGQPFLGWVYEGSLLVGDSSSDRSEGVLGPSDGLERRLGRRCVRVHRRELAPPWLRVIAEFRGEGTPLGHAPDRVAGARAIVGEADMPDHAVPRVLPGPPTDDCLVVVHTREPMLLGRRFMLDYDATSVGRGAHNHISLYSALVSRRHARFEKREQGWWIVDVGSGHGTFCDDERIRPRRALTSGDRVTIGGTSFKFLSGADAGARCREEIARLNMVNRDPSRHDRQSFHEALDHEIARGRSEERDLSIVRFDVDNPEGVSEEHGRVAGHLARYELERTLPDWLSATDILARLGEDSFGIILPRTALSSAVERAEALREHVRAHPFTYATIRLAITVRTGTAQLEESDRSADDLVKRAEAQLSSAARGDDPCSTGV